VTLTYALELYWVKQDHHAKYLDYSKLLYENTYTHTHTHTQWTHHTTWTTEVKIVNACL